MDYSTGLTLSEGGESKLCMWLEMVLVAVKTGKAVVSAGVERMH